jgi:hypothetical protein
MGGGHDSAFTIAEEKKENEEVTLNVKGMGPQAVVEADDSLFDPLRIDLRLINA